MKLYIGNLPSHIDDVQLRELTLPFGEPDSANIARYLIGGSSKGFGFIDYSNADAGRAAIAGLHGKDLDGQALTVFEATIARARRWAGRRTGN
jgi:RNA recognition motif-containing protein